MNGTTQCSGDDSSPCNVPNITRAGKTEPPPACHPDRVKRAEGSTQVASFPLWWFLYQRGGFLRSANATVGMTDVFALVVTNSNVPRFRLTPDGGRLPPLHCVVPFNRTGCNCNVAGGMVAAPTGVCRADARLSLFILPKKECRNLVKNT